VCEESSDVRRLRDPLRARHLGNCRIWIPEAVGSEPWDHVQVQVEWLAIGLDVVLQYYRAVSPVQPRHARGQAGDHGNKFTQQLGRGVMQIVHMSDGQDEPVGPILEPLAKRRNHVYRL